MGPFTLDILGLDHIFVIGMVKVMNPPKFQHGYFIECFTDPAVQDKRMSEFYFTA
jgi:hypothetical protein